MRRVLAWIGSCLVVGVALAIPAQPAHAQNTVHNDCDYCHNVHGGGGFIPLTDHNRDVDLCLSCHDDGAPPTYNGETVPKGVAVHAGTDHAAADTTSCIDCHDHEGEAGGNLALIPRQLNSRYTGLKTVVFTARAGANSFADGNTAYDGVCEVCHTQTKYHVDHAVTPDTARIHNAGATCTVCHTHTSGFQPSGGCTVCHSTAQDNGDGVPIGGRRAIVSEFGRSSHHVQVTPADSVPDADCTTCHDLAQHQQGSVRLKNADNAGIVYALTGDPATNSNEAAKLTDFCLSCHDADAAGGSTPFSDGQTPPVIDNVFWVASSHEQSAPIVGCYGDGLFGCHATGHGSAQQSLLAPAGTAPTPPANAEEEEAFCYVCHDANGPASTNVQGEFAKGTNTSTRTYHHPVNDSEQATTGTGRAVECVDCHNPHQATSTNRVKGVTGIDLAGNPVGPGTANPRDPGAYEVCLKCHGDTFLSGRDLDGDGRADASNKRLDFAASASAYHPVQQAGRNTSTALQNQLVGGLTTASTISCSDCHNNQQTANAQGRAANSTAGPKGPHGSTIFPIQRANLFLGLGTSSDNPRPASDVALCLLCHNQNDVISRNSDNTNYYKGDNLHGRHWDGWADGVSCRTCHYNIHGNQSASNTIYRIVDGTTTDYQSPPVGYKTRMIDFAPNVTPNGFTKPLFRINVTTRQRACGLTCHGKQHDANNGDFQYTPPSAGDNDSLKYP
ncbi:MAG: cytochrome c3 family protein [Gemmatimonadota bacterium]|nr:cytochrome c3 family protein [Gemmatimonadota bacterium]